MSDFLDRELPWVGQRRGLARRHGSRFALGRAALQRALREAKEALGPFPVSGALLAGARGGPGEVMDFLLQKEVLATRDPCLVPKADMRRLVTLAGFERTHLAYHQVEAAADPMLALREGMLQLIRMARELPSAG